jgi:ATP-dependent protease ClpP protease subunit
MNTINTAPNPPQAAPSNVYVTFSAEINPNTTEALIAVLSNCANQRVKQVNILLSTPGGSVMHGLNLYNVIRSMPYEVTMHNVGNVDSIGNAIFLAGKRRYACEHSTFMFHGVGFDVAGQGRLDEKACRERLDSLMSDQKRIGDIITQNTTLPPHEVETLFREAQTKDATAATGFGIVHEIKDAHIPAGGPVISLVFQR